MADPETELAQLKTLVSQMRLTMGKMEVALGAIGEAIVWTDRKGAIQWCNRTFDQLMPLPHVRVLGLPLVEALPLLQDGQAVPRAEHPMSLLMGGRDRVEGRYQFQRHGRPVPVNVTGSPALVGEGDVDLIYVFVLRAEGA